MFRLCHNIATNESTKLLFFFFFLPFFFYPPFSKDHDPGWLIWLVWHSQNSTLEQFWAGTCPGIPGSSHRLAWRVLGCLSKQIKGIRALKDHGGCFYVLPQAAVAPVGLEEWVMGLKHSACSQMQGTLYRTSKCSIIYILVIHSGIFNGRQPCK